MDHVWTHVRGCVNERGGRTFSACVTIDHTALGKKMGNNQIKKRDDRIDAPLRPLSSARYSGGSKVSRL